MTAMKRTVVFALLLLVLFGVGGKGVVSAETSKTCFVPSLFYPTIQVALSSHFGTCTEIYLSNRVYRENIDFSFYPQDQDLVIHGQDRKETIIDGDATGSVFYGSGVNVTLSNLTIKNGSAENGGGIHFRTGSRVTMQNVVLENNTATNDGGAVFGDSSTEIIIQDSLIQNNYAGNDGGAISVRSATGKLNISGTVIQNNSAQNDGGGIHLYQATGEISGMLIKGNTSSDGDGGAVYAQDAMVTVTNSAIESNSALLGGGLMLNLSNYSVQHVGISNNSATYYGGGVYVNPIYAIPYEDTLSDFSITENEAQNGGGIAVFPVENIRVKLERGLVSENSASGNGGGIDGNVDINSLAVINNSAGFNGGGIVTNDALITNSTISGNSAGIVGAGISADRLKASYVTVAYNSGVAAIYNFPGMDTPVEFDNSIIYNPYWPDCAGDGDIVIGVNTLADGSCSMYAAPNRMNLTGLDPMLEPLSENGGSSPTHALHPDSPVIGIGIDCETQDQRGMLRSGDSCDLGAFQTDARVPTAIQLTAQTANAAARSSLTIGILLLSLTMGLVIWRRKQPVG